MKDGVTFIAVPAVDGFGDPQASWVVGGGGKKIKLTSVSRTQDFRMRSRKIATSRHGLRCWSTSTSRCRPALNSFASRRSAGDPLRTNPWDAYANAIKARLRAQIQRLSVFVSPREVVRMLWPDNRAQVLSLG